MGVRSLPFEELRDPATGRTRVRLVDVQSEHYKVARDYMIRLGPHDLEDPEMRAKLAETARMTPKAFKKKFASAVSLTDGWVDMQKQLNGLGQ